MTSANHTPETLKKQYQRGVITLEEYQKMLAKLKETKK